MGCEIRRSFSGDGLNQVAFPLGGIGAGMVCLEGTGALSHVSVRNRPEVFFEPCFFSTLGVRRPAGDAVVRVLEGPVPGRKVFGSAGAAQGLGQHSYGLPRYSSSEFGYRFPFAEISFEDDLLPVETTLTGWSPFTPGDADSSSLPVAALEYRFRNLSAEPLEAVFSCNSKNFLAVDDSARVLDIAGGFVLDQSASAENPWDASAFCIRTDAAEAIVDCRWFRGGWFDALTILWQHLEKLECPANGAFPEGELSSSGGSLFVPFTLAPGEEREIRIMLSWYSPDSELRCGCAEDNDLTAEGNSSRLVGQERYRPWYAAKFADIHAVSEYFRDNYCELRKLSELFADCFYDSSLPPEILDAISANFAILKSPTVLRQQDGRLWAWEGCCDGAGCCYGSCTHVWNYAQALPHLFPDLERGLRETEFFESQDERGHQDFRAAMPIGATQHKFHAAADGQLGGIMKVYRDWRISGDGGWLKKLWPQLKSSLDYCIKTWDPGHEGILREPHHNTYDIEFWGPDGMCGSFYLGALRAIIEIGRELGEDTEFYGILLEKGKSYLENRLYDGEYFIQEIQWQGLRAGNPLDHPSEINNRGGYSPEAVEIMRREGPKYQYGTGCLADGVLGEWMARVCGLGRILDESKVISHLAAVYRYNFRTDLRRHANPQRPAYALGNEGGLLLCTWPKEGELSLPFVYSNEVWTGIEYQLAAHLAAEGMRDEALSIVRTLRQRYDGRIRNPFNEYECGHWYARALASYALLQTWYGIRYDGVERVLYVEAMPDEDFRCFLATATGYGTVIQEGGEIWIDIKHGGIEIDRIIRS